MFFVLFMIVPAMLVMLALLTQAGTVALGWIYPPQGKFVDVPGARLHVVDIGPSAPGELPIVMIAGANSNLETIRKPLGDLLAAKHRVILIDRPGQGWSTRERLEDSTPAIHARMIDQALGKLGIVRAIFVGHSWAGAVLPAISLENPQRVAGLVMISPVTHPWRGEIGTLTDVATMPVIVTASASQRLPNRPRTKSAAVMLVVPVKSYVCPLPRFDVRALSPVDALMNDSPPCHDAASLMSPPTLANRVPRRGMFWLKLLLFG